MTYRVFLDNIQLNQGFIVRLATLGVLQCTRNVVSITKDIQNTTFALYNLQAEKILLPSHQQRCHLSFRQFSVYVI